MTGSDRLWAIAEVMAWWNLRRQTTDPTLSFGVPLPQAAFPSRFDWAEAEAERIRCPLLGVIGVPDLQDYYRVEFHSSDTAAALVRQVEDKRSSQLWRHDVYPTDSVMGAEVGSLMVFVPHETVRDGAAALASNGFFNGADEPPADVWVEGVWTDDGLQLLFWIPPESEGLIKHAAKSPSCSDSVFQEVPWGKLENWWQTS